MMSEKVKRLIEENMDKLEVTIKSLAIKFNVPACDFDDYRQTAYLTLCNKAYKYDGSTKFITFANTVIINAMIDKYRREKNRNTEMVSLNDACFESEDETNLMDFLASENDTENDKYSFAGMLLPVRMRRRYFTVLRCGKRSLTG